jgi:DNA-directed RNA polymerase specialized sigma24 family protein
MKPIKERVVSMGLIRDANRVTGYAMPRNFCQIFNDDLDHLYTLSLLLTADLQKAEHCFVAGLEDCLEGNPVFREWAQSWAKRTVITNAIRVISPVPTETISQSENGEAIDVISEIDGLAAAITKLPPFDRFVYVLSVLEKYSDRECSILLGCTVEEIMRTRTRAICRVVSMVTREGAEELAAAV